MSIHRTTVTHTTVTPQDEVETHEQKAVTPAGYQVQVLTIPAAPWISEEVPKIADAFTFYSKAAADGTMTYDDFKRVCAHNTWAEHQRLNEDEWNAGVAATPAPASAKV